jgi:hypothetical protein
VPANAGVNDDPGIEEMTTLTQTYLFERDAGVLCRILGLYAARGMEVLAAHYEYAAKDIMSLRVSVRASEDDIAESLRVLVDKVSTFWGVIAACEHQSSNVESRRCREAG